MASLFQQTVDDALLNQARRGDAAAQAELFSRFGRPVYNLARRLLVNPDLAEDVLQDTFVEVLRNLQKFRGDAPLGMWIRSIAVNHCLSHLRSPWRRLRIEMVDTNNAQQTPEAQRDSDVLDLQRALDALSPEARAVVWLHDVEGYTHQEIGRLMRATTSYSKSQLVRAYARMRNWADNQAGDKTCTPVLSN